MRLLASTAPRATILIRLLVGFVFVSEGIQKFLYPATLGVGRFMKIGIPAPHLLAPFVGAVEISCGLFIALGILTRLAAVPLVAVMLVALKTTKWAVLMHDGFWVAAHESRADLSMLFCLLFLAFVGAGPLAVDAVLEKRRSPPGTRTG